MDAINETRNLLTLQKRAEELKRRSDPKHMECIEKEGNAAMEEFSRIVEEEEERVQQVVDKENERIMRDMRTNGTHTICPLCLEEISPIRNVENVNIRTMCCGAINCCNDCAEKSAEFMLEESGYDVTNAKCYYCREPIRSSEYWAKDIKPDDKRHWLLNNLAVSYLNGTDGLKKNTNKAITFTQRSAELGNRFAQDLLAQFYFYGNFPIPQCLQKARYYAEKAADQGVMTSQYIMAEVIKKASDDTNTSEEEVFRLHTLAAFQGSINGRYGVALHYWDRYDLLTIGDDEDWRRNLLLSIYWFGKTAEVEAQGPKGCKSLSLMALQLHEAMKVWHLGFRSDPLPGYSHIPFITWALNKGGEKADTRMMTRPFDYVWKRECASCGSLDKEQLKACARCKAFYYCSKKCQVEHWKAGHKVDCKGHWIEKYFPAIRSPKPRESCN